MKARAMVVAGISLMMLFGCGKSKETYEKSFKDSFRKSFVKSCTEGATKGGVKEDVAKAKCECMANHITEKLNSTELTKLATTTDSPDSKKAFEDAISACK